MSLGAASLVGAALLYGASHYVSQLSLDSSRHAQFLSQIPSHSVHSAINQLRTTSQMHNDQYTIHTEQNNGHSSTTQSGSTMYPSQPSLSHPSSSTATTTPLQQYPTHITPTALTCSIVGHTYTPPNDAVSDMDGHNKVILSVINEYDIIEKYTESKPAKIEADGRVSSPAVLSSYQIKTLTGTIARGSDFYLIDTSDSNLLSQSSLHLSNISSSSSASLSSSEVNNGYIPTLHGNSLIIPRNRVINNNNNNILYDILNLNNTHTILNNNNLVVINNNNNSSNNSNNNTTTTTKTTYTTQSSPTSLDTTTPSAHPSPIVSSLPPSVPLEIQTESYISSSSHNSSLNFNLGPNHTDGDQPTRPDQHSDIVYPTTPLPTTVNPNMVQHPSSVPSPPALPSTSPSSRAPSSVHPSTTTTQTTTTTTTTQQQQQPSQQQTTIPPPQFIGIRKEEYILPYRTPLTIIGNIYQLPDGNYTIGSYIETQIAQHTPGSSLSVSSAATATAASVQSVHYVEHKPIITKLSREQVIHNIRKQSRNMNILSSLLSYSSGALGLYGTYALLLSLNSWARTTR